MPNHPPEPQPETSQRQDEKQLPPEQQHPQQQISQRSTETTAPVITSQQQVPSSQTTKPENTPPSSAQTQPSSSFWLNFFLQEFDEQTSLKYEKLFLQNELTEKELPDLDHELLKSMDISVAKTRLKIMKMKSDWVDKGTSGVQIITASGSSSRPVVVKKTTSTKAVATAFEEHIKKINQ